MTQTAVKKEKAPRLPRTGNSTFKNTAKCILVLAVIAVVCVSLLAVANRFLRVTAQLDRATGDLINSIAPTGADDETAFRSYIELADLGSGNYAIKNLDEYNKQYGSANQKVRALYVSTHKDTGHKTLVVEAEGKGYVDAIVMLVAYDDDNKVSGVVTKSQSESYWSHIKDFDRLYAAFIGTSGRVDSASIAASTGVTVRGTLGGMASAVSIANDFVSRLGGADTTKPVPETDSAKLAQLAKVSLAQSFTRYGVGTADIAAAYVGNNGDIVIEANGNGGSYGEVTLLVKVANGKAEKITRVRDSFDPIPDNNSEPLRQDAKLNELFGGKTLAEVRGMQPNLPGITGATQSQSGVIAAVKNALTYAETFSAEGV